MLAWMMYATIVGVLFAAGGALLEQFSPWTAGGRRLVWLAVIVGTLAMAVIAAVAAPPQPVATPARETTPVVPSPMQPTTSLGPLVGNAPDTHAASPRAATTVNGALPSLDVVLLLVWLAGSVLCLAVLVGSAWRVSRMRRAWRESVIAGVPVLVSHDVGPAVIGLVHHGIVVPAWVEALGDDEQRTVMTHEREHVRAGDPLLLWGATLLVSLAPWNIALWYALRRLRHAIEIDCDGRVLRSRPDARAYCTLLLDVGERTLAGVAPIAALAEPATLLERRIAAMTMPARVHGRRVVSSALATLALVAVACWTPRPAVSPRARIAVLVRELDSLLASEPAQRSLTTPERENAARVSAAAMTNVADDTLRSTRYSHLVDSLARADYPEVFEKHDDASVLTVLFTSDGKIARKAVARLPLGDVFDVLTGATDETLSTRNLNYILARMFNGPLPMLSLSGAEYNSSTPHTVLLYGVLIEGERVPALRGRESAPPGSGRYK